MSLDPGTSCPVPRFGRVPADLTPQTVLRDGRPRWQPGHGLESVHRPGLVATLLDRVMDAVRDPIHRCVIDGRPGIALLGLGLLARSSDGALHGWAWAPQEGRPSLQPILPGNLVVHPCPAGLQWLDNAVKLFGLELSDQLRAEHGAAFDPDETSSRIAEYLPALRTWLARQLKRHADLRAMRRKVADALALDPATLGLARRIQRDAEHGHAAVTDASWNVAVRHRTSLEQVGRELPQSLTLYGALLAAGELPDHAPMDAIAVMRRHLIAAGVWPSTWRLLTRSSGRLLLPARNYYSGPFGRAMIDHLLVLQALGLAHEPPAEVIDSIWSREGHPDRRWPDYLGQLGGRRAPSFGHTIRCYAATRARTSASELTALRASMHDVVAWIAEARPRITKNQRRAGWVWMASQAERWRAIRLAEQAHGKAAWPVADEVLDGPYRLRMLGSFADLMVEAQTMHHCVFEHRFDCADGRAIVVSIRRCSDDRRVATALYDRDYPPLNAEWRPARWKLSQVRSALNGAPPRAAARAAGRLTGMLQTWSDLNRAQANSGSSSGEAETGDETVAEAGEFDAVEDLDHTEEADGALGMDMVAAVELDATPALRWPGPRVRRLVWFSCEMGCTLVADDFTQPTCNADVHSAVQPSDLRSPADVVALADSVHSVARVLGTLVEDNADDLHAWMEGTGLTRRQRKRLAEALDALYDGDPGHALAEWLSRGGEDALAACRAAVADWLTEPPDYDDWESFDTDAASAQGAAMSWFNCLEWAELNELGVRIVEGDHPGSTYHGAELRTSVEEANAAARRLGLPCRFR